MGLPTTLSTGGGRRAIEEGSDESIKIIQTSANACQIAFLLKPCKPELLRITQTASGRFKFYGQTTPTPTRARQQKIRNAWPGSHSLELSRLTLGSCAAIGYVHKIAKNWVLECCCLNQLPTQALQIFFRGQANVTFEAPCRCRGIETGRAIAASLCVKTLNRFVAPDRWRRVWTSLLLISS